LGPPKVTVRGEPTREDKKTSARQSAPDKKRKEGNVKGNNQSQIKSLAKETSA